MPRVEVKHAMEAELQFSRGIDVVPVVLFVVGVSKVSLSMTNCTKDLVTDADIRSWINLKCTDDKL